MSLQCRPRRKYFIDRPRHHCQIWLKLPKLSRTHSPWCCLRTVMCLLTDALASVDCSSSVTSVHASILPKTPCGCAPHLSASAHCDINLVSPIERIACPGAAILLSRAPSCHCRSRTTSMIRSDLQEVDVHTRAYIDVTRPLDTCPWPTLRTCLTLFIFTFPPATRSNSQTALPACPPHSVQGTCGLQPSSRILRIYRHTRCATVRRLLCLPPTRPPTSTLHRASHSGLLVTARPLYLSVSLY